jgi:hypothetical protein
MEEIQRNFDDFNHPDVEAIAIIRGRVLQALQQYLLERDFKQSSSQAVDAHPHVVTDAPSPGFSIITGRHL